MDAVTRPGISGSGTLNNANRLVSVASAATVKESLILDAVTAGVLSIAKTGSTARTVTFPDASITVARIDAAQTFTGQSTFTDGIISSHCDAASAAGMHIGNNTHQDVAMFGAGGGQGTTLYGQLNCLAVDSTSATGIITRQAATQDAIQLLGRAGGASSYVGSITTTTLTASRTYTLPDASIVVSGSASALTTGRVPFATTGGILTDDAKFTYSTDTLVVGNGLLGPAIHINGAAGNTRGLLLRTASSNRWYVYEDSVAETGSDAGSGFKISAYTDGGTFIDNPIAIARVSGGTITLARPVSCSSTLAVTSNAGIGGATSSSAVLNIGATNPLSGVTQVGVLGSMGATSGATTAIRSFQSSTTMSAGSYTTGEWSHFYCGSMTVPSGVTVTNWYGLYVQAPTITGTITNLYGIRSQIASGSGRYNLYCDGTAANYLAGVTTVANTTDATTTATGGLILSGGLGIAKSVVQTASSAGATYWGPTGTDGTVRMYGNGSGQLIIEARVSGAYTEIGRIG